MSGRNGARHRLLSQLDAATAGLVGQVFERQEAVAIEGPDGRPIARIVPANPNEGRRLADLIADDPSLGELRIPAGSETNLPEAMDWLRRCPHCGQRVEPMAAPVQPVPLAAG